MAKKSKRFTIWENEGSFFDEPWLHDSKENKDYRYNKVPPRIKRAFAADLRERGTMTPNEAAMIVGWVEHMK